MWFELIHRIVWYIHSYEYFRGAFWVCLHGPSDDGSNWSRPSHLSLPFILHGPITEKTTISTLMLYIFHALYHFVTKKLMYTCQAIHSPVMLHYTLV